MKYRIVPEKKIWEGMEEWAKELDEMVKLDRVADKVLAYRARARTPKAKKRQRKARKAQRDSCI